MISAADITLSTYSFCSTFDVKDFSWKYYRGRRWEAVNVVWVVCLTLSRAFPPLRTVCGDGSGAI